VPRGSHRGLADPSTAADWKARRVRATARPRRTGERRSGSGGIGVGHEAARLYAKARAILGRLVDAATAADTEGNLDVSLATLTAAATSLLAALPA
jgi:hypothetical protein